MHTSSLPTLATLTHYEVTQYGHQKDQFYKTAKKSAISVKRATDTVGM